MFRLGQNPGQLLDAIALMLQDRYLYYPRNQMENLLLQEYKEDNRWRFPIPEMVYLAVAVAVAIEQAVAVEQAVEIEVEIPVAVEDRNQ